MTPEAQRIAIAEACGWKNQGKAKGVPALNHRWAKPDGRIYSGALPAYLTDLNAMHEAEKVLTPEQQWPYAQALFRVLEGNGVLSSSFATLHATAAQRAEAFLRTIGKWTDD